MIQFPWILSLFTGIYIFVRAWKHKKIYYNDDERHKIWKQGKKHLKGAVVSLLFGQFSDIFSLYVWTVVHYFLCCSRYLFCIYQRPICEWGPNLFLAIPFLKPVRQIETVILECQILQSWYYLNGIYTTHNLEERTQP